MSLSERLNPPLVTQANPKRLSLSSKRQNSSSSISSKYSSQSQFSQQSKPQAGFFMNGNDRKGSNTLKNHKKSPSVVIEGGREGGGKRRRVAGRTGEDDSNIYLNGNHVDTVVSSAEVGKRKRKNKSISEVKEVTVSWWTKYEVPRKALHSSIGFVTAYLWIDHTPVPPLVKYLTGACAFIFANDLVRFRWQKFEVAYEALLGHFMRESEKTEVNGVIWYLVGVVPVLAFLPRDLAVLSILMLSWVDTTASVVGRTWGYLTPKLPSPFGRKKSWAGFAGAFVCGALTAYGFYTYLAPLGHQNDLSIQLPNIPPSTYPLPPDPTPLGRLPSPNSTLSLSTFSLICGLIAAVAEGLDLWKLDDNVTIPLLFGGLCYGIMWMLG